MMPPGWTPLRPGEPFAAQLLAASRAGQGLDCGGAPVAAGELRAAGLTGGRAADPFGLLVGRATITGSLDLQGCEVPAPLRFTGCSFTDPVDVRGARLGELVFDGDARASRPSVLPGLLAAGSRIARDLVLSGMVVTGELPAPRTENRTTASIWLTEADIGGSLVMAGTQILPASGRALRADRIRVGGNIRLLDGFRATGEVRLLAMRLTGTLDIAGAEFAPADGRAIDISESAIGGSLFLLSSPNTGRRCRVRGRIEMGHSTIQGELFIRDADLTAPAAGDGAHFYNVAPRAARTFLLAPRLTVHGALLIEGDTVVRGGLVLPGAQLEGGLKLEGALWNPGDTALDLEQAILGSGIEAPRVSIEGRVDLNNAKIEGPINLEGTVLAAPPERRCLTVVNARVAGDVRLRGLTALGGSLNFRGASIGGVFSAEDAFISNPGDKTIGLHMAHVAGTVRLCGRFRSVGVVVLNRMVVDGRLRADGATLAWRPAPAPLHPPGETNARGCALEAISAEIRGGIGLGWQILEGTVDLTGTTAPFLADRPEDWPAGSYIGGLAYERFEPVEARGAAVWDAGARIAWLDRMEPFDPRAWERLAAVLRAAGDRDGADTVLVAQRRRARRARALPGRIFDILQDVTVRYGFRPQRALYLLLALLAAVTVALSLPAVQEQMRATDQNALVFSPSGVRPGQDEGADGRCGDGKVRCLNPFFYAVDTVVPLIDLHQRATWYPDSERHGALLEWLLNLCTILGWVASTVFALSFTRLVRSS
ncbi:hypothetical protein [Actinoplanes sp. NPDC026619]|uniref:hypothetical protein n=1 Tax=Actinoplanes sp. NPDC026619 TaxID=3155798 RepID=UPI0033ED9B8A